LNPTYTFQNFKRQIGTSDLLTFVRNSTPHTCGLLTYGDLGKTVIHLSECLIMVNSDANTLV